MHPSFQEETLDTNLKNAERLIYPDDIQYAKNLEIVFIKKKILFIFINICKLYNYTFIVTIKKNVSKCYLLKIYQYVNFEINYKNNATK